MGFPEPIKTFAKLDIKNCAHVKEGEHTRFTVFLGENADKTIRVLSVCQSCWGNIMSMCYDNMVSIIGKNLSNTSLREHFPHHD